MDSRRWTMERKKKEKMNWPAIWPWVDVPSRNALWKAEWSGNFETWHAKLTVQMCFSKVVRISTEYQNINVAVAVWSDNKFGQNEFLGSQLLNTHFVLRNINGLSFTEKWRAVSEGSPSNVHRHCHSIYTESSHPKSPLAVPLIESMKHIHEGVASRYWQRQGKVHPPEQGKMTETSLH